MIWVCFAGNRVGVIHWQPEILYQHGYHSVPQRQAGTHLIGVRFVLMQDNDQKHKSKLCKIYMQKKNEENNLTAMKWPLQ